VYWLRLGRREVARDPIIRTQGLMGIFCAPKCASESKGTIALIAHPAINGAGFLQDLRPARFATVNMDSLLRESMSFLLKTIDRIPCRC